MSMAADGDPPPKRQHTGSAVADGAVDAQRQAQQTQGSASAQAADGDAGAEGGSGDGGGLAGLLGGYGSDDSE